MKNIEMSQDQEKSDQIFKEAFELHKKGMIAEAKVKYLEILQIDNNHLNALQLLGLVELEFNNCNDAIFWLKKALSIEKNNASIFNNLGNAELKLDHFSLAVEYYSEAIQIGGDNIHQTFFNRGFAKQKMKQWIDSIEDFNQAISLEPNIAEYFFNLAVSHESLSNFDFAKQNYMYAIELNPNYYDAYLNLGALLEQSNYFPAALECYQKIIDNCPQNPIPYNNKANILQKLGLMEEALVFYDKAISLKINSPITYLNKANIQRELGLLENSLQTLDNVISINPEYSEAFYNRALVLQDLKKLQESLKSIDRAIELNSNVAFVHNNRGSVLQELNNFSEALISFNKAIELDENFAGAYNNRGVVLKELADLDEALSSLNKAISLKVDYIEAYSNRGVLLQTMLRVEESIISFDKAIQLDPDYSSAYWNKSLALLLNGNFLEGWKLFEWRFRNSNLSAYKSKRNFNEPLWIGEESLRGKRILIYSEQGLGDTLQFCRYVEKFSALGAQVILEVPTALKELMKGLKGVTELVTFGEVLPLFDYQCPMMSLPLAFKTELDTIPANIPYLSCSEEKKTYWKIRLGEHCKLRVGLVWSGGFRPNQPEVWAVNNRRNIPLEKLRVLKNADIEFYSLQKGEPAESELRTLQEQSWDGPEVIDFTSELNDFTDTAGLIENLDLVISVDTSTAHLAGALGKPVWVLNRFDTCWRWLLERDDSPWYPSLKLYRQESIGNWDSVVDKVKTDLFKMK